MEENRKDWLGIFELRWTLLNPIYLNVKRAWFLLWCCISILNDFPEIRSILYRSYDYLPIISSVQKDLKTNYLPMYGTTEEISDGKFFFFKQEINIRGNEQCTFCQNDTKTLIHLFLVLSHFQSFLARVWAMAVNRGEMSNTIKGEGHSKKHIFLSSPIKKVYIELSYSPKFQSLKCLLSQEICLQSSLKFGIGNRHFETNA